MSSDSRIPPPLRAVSPGRAEKSPSGGNDKSFFPKSFAATLLALALLAALLVPAQPAGAQATNSPPSIVGPSISSGDFDENATGQARTYRATDPDGDTVTWSITSVDPISATSWFAITPDTGILTVETPLDYEYALTNNPAGAQYRLIVTADDGNGGTDTQEFLVNVSDVDEPPGRPGMPVAKATGRKTLTVSWAPPWHKDMEGKPPVTHYEVQYCKEGDDCYNYGTGWSGASTTDTGTTHAFPSLALERETIYRLRVRAVSDEGESFWSLDGFGFTGCYDAPWCTGLGAGGEGTIGYSRDPWSGSANGKFGILDHPSFTHGGTTYEIVEILDSKNYLQVEFDVDREALEGMSFYIVDINKEEHAFWFSDAEWHTDGNVALWKKGKWRQKRLLKSGGVYFVSIERRRIPPTIVHKHIIKPNDYKGKDVTLKWKDGSFAAEIRIYSRRNGDPSYGSFIMQNNEITAIFNEHGSNPRTLILRHPDYEEQILLNWESVYEQIHIEAMDMDSPPRTASVHWRDGQWAATISINVDNFGKPAGRTESHAHGVLVEFESHGSNPRTATVTHPSRSDERIKFIWWIRHVEPVVLSYIMYPDSPDKEVTAEFPDGKQVSITLTVATDEPSPSHGLIVWGDWPYYVKGSVSHHPTDVIFEDTKLGYNPNSVTFKHTTPQYYNIVIKWEVREREPPPDTIDYGPGPGDVPGSGAAPTVPPGVGGDGAPVFVESDPVSLSDPEGDDGDEEEIGFTVEDSGDSIEALGGGGGCAVGGAGGGAGSAAFGLFLITAALFAAVSYGGRLRM